MIIVSCLHFVNFFKVFAKKFFCFKYKLYIYTIIKTAEIMTTKEMTFKIGKFLTQFPNDATSWGQATDEVRDLARTAKEYYNEIDLDLLSSEVEDGAGQQPLDFRAIKTPAEWNTKGKAYIMEVFEKMSDQTKRQFFDNFKTWFE